MPENLSSQWADCTELIQRYSRFLIASHVNPDGDAVGSAIALRRLLESMGKEAHCVFADEPSPSLQSFYDPAELSVYSRDPVSFQDYEVTIVTDAGNWQRLGDVGDVFSKHPGMKICIDHHPVSMDFPGLHIVDTESPSTTVLIHRYARFLQEPFTVALAEPIYLGLIVDTINFHLPNTTVESHTIAAECLHAGVNPTRVYQPIFGTLPFTRMRLMASVFEHAEVCLGGTVGVLFTTQAMLDESQAGPGDDEGFSDLSRNIEGVSVGVYLREIEDGRVKVSWRTREEFSILESARFFGGGGHQRAAGARIQGSIEEVKARVLADLKTRIDAGEFTLPRQQEVSPGV